MKAARSEKGIARLRVARPFALDLTVGPPLRRILLFMVPLLIGNLFQQLYSMVDTVIVGNAIGAAALAGVGSTGAMSFLIMGFVTGLTHGFSVVTSQRRGARDEEGMRRSFATGILLTVGIISVLTVVAVFVAEPLLIAMNTSEEIFPYALDYIKVIFGGMLLSAFYNEFSSTLRAIGDSVVPLLFLILSSFLNVGLDALFVLGLNMGVEGAAAATLISQGLSAALTFIYMWIKYPMLRFGIGYFRPNAGMIFAQLKLGVPMALQMSIISIGMIFGQSALNAMDNVEMNAAYVSASRIDNFACAAVNSAGAAAATYVAQNFGARRYDRIKQGMRRLLLFDLALSVTLGVIVIALHRPLIMIFIKPEERSEALFGYALTYLLCNGGFYMLLASLCACRSALQGMGRGTLTMVSAAVEVCMRIAASLLAEYLASYTFVCSGNALAWLGANLVLVPCFLITLAKYTPLIRRRVKDIHLTDPSLIPALTGRRKTRIKKRLHF